jgi:hypothetical protein
MVNEFFYNELFERIRVPFSDNESVKKNEIVKFYLLTRLSKFYLYRLNINLIC